MSNINNPTISGHTKSPETISITPEDKSAKLDRRPICRDFLNGRCYRTVCSYQHNVALLRPAPKQGNHAQPQQLPPLFQHMFIPGKGYCFVSLQNYIQQSVFNGLFIINLADIIPTSIFSKLLASTTPDKSDMVIKQITSLAGSWANKLQQIIKWSLISTPNFNKSNYGIVFIFDISLTVSDWIAKIGHTSHYHQGTNKLIQCLSNKLTQLFTEIFSYSELQDYPLKYMNIIINYMNDELAWINKGCLEMLYGMITLSPDKYISTQFYSNIYYIGLPPNLTKCIGSVENKGFIFSSITGAKFINLAMIYTSTTGNDTSGVDITYLADTEINTNIQAYNWHLSNNHNSKIYQTLFEKNDTLKKTLASMIPTDNIRGKSLVIIGCNLDVDFDKQILAGLKEVVGSIDFTGLSAASVRDKPLEKLKNGKPDVKPSQAKKTSDDCCSGGGDSSGITMSIILPIMNNPGLNIKTGSDNSANQLNDMMRGLLTGQMPSNTNITSKLIQNRVCTLGLKIITNTDGQLSFTQPWITIPGIEKIKEYGSQPDNKIIIICSSRLNHSFFQEFISQITKTPGYTKNISANFIDFNINPSLRSCLSYYNYRVQVQANYGNIGQITGAADNLLIKNTKLWLRFTQHISVINPNFDYNSIPVGSNCLSSNPGISTCILLAENKTDCCQCCSCLSRNGVGYVKFGNMPYIPKTALDEIKDDSWIPRF